MATIVLWPAAVAVVAVARPANVARATNVAIASDDDDANLASPALVVGALS